ncbi:MAG: SDR family oxidoreductase [Motiliproteus sp.]
MNNKVGIITGATSGIGEAVARAMAAQGFNLVIHGRNEQKLQSLAAKLNAVYLKADISEPSTPAKLLQLALERYGRCDIAVNNAGTIEVGPIDTINIDKMSSMVRVNVEAAYRFIYHMVRHFQAQGSGDLVNISSVMGTKARLYAGAYSGTKFAIEALSESLRMELARTDVRISCIEPGLVETELQRDWEVQPSVSMNIPNPLQPSDVAVQVMHVINQPAGIKIPRLMILPRDHEI